MRFLRHIPTLLCVLLLIALFPYLFGTTGREFAIKRSGGGFTTYTSISFACGIVGLNRYTVKTPGSSGFIVWTIGREPASPRFRYTHNAAYDSVVLVFPLPLIMLPLAILPTLALIKFLRKRRQPGRFPISSEPVAPRKCP